jgi:Cu/Ag efflux protein CusF
MQAHRILWLIAVCSPLALVGCGPGPSEGKKEDGENLYDFKGKVVAVDAKERTVKLDHEDIPGLMKGMKNMPFKVEDAKLLEGIQVGDEIEGKVRKDYVIRELKKR